MQAHLDDVPWTAHEHGDVRAERQRLGAAAGARDVGLSRYRIAPGCRAMALHVHADEEEIFFVLAGSGCSWQDETYGTRDSGDMCWYPDSSKILFGGLGVIARVQALDYWDGEA